VKTTANEFVLRQALDNVNSSKGYSIEFNRFDRTGKWVNFTLKTKSGIAGARISPSGRNIPSASWHAHGYFFDEVFNLDPAAVIYSQGRKITAEEGNWIDINFGSQMLSLTSIL